MQVTVSQNHRLVPRSAWNELPDVLRPELKDAEHPIRRSTQSVGTS